MVLTVNDSADAYFSAAGLWFDNANNLYVKLALVAPAGERTPMLHVVDEAFYYLSDLESLGNGVYKFTSHGLYATEFDTAFTYELIVSENVVASLTYSVNAYAYGILQSTTESEAMKNLALALYRYGVSAEAYVNGDGGNVTTVTEAE